jgi:glycosyltransferase involved in cell wall biosynthesis
MTNEERISVIVPTYNRGNYILEAVESVLSQTYRLVELIVVDDGSTDDTGRILSELEADLIYIRQENRGFAAARNVGVDNSSGSFLAFLDSDDIWLEDKLRMQMEVFEHSPETDVVYGRARQFISPELAEDEKAPLLHMDGKDLPSPLACSMLIRRRAFERVGPFDESLCIGVEMEWYARLSDRKCNVKMLDKVVYRRRLHKTNINLTRADEQPERLRVLKKILDRRRGRKA